LNFNSEITFFFKKELFEAAISDDCLAFLNLIVHNVDIDMCNSYGKTALHESIHSGNYLSVEMLVLNRAKIHLKDNADCNALHYVIFYLFIYLF
jgi:ankyrin repeat protein